jgi:hypothetical protein
MAPDLHLLGYTYNPPRIDFGGAAAAKCVVEIGFLLLHQPRWTSAADAAQSNGGCDILPH